MRKNNIITLIVVLLSAFSTFGAYALEKNSRATVKLIDSIAVTAPSITLGEISEIESKNTELKESLEKIIIDRVPAIGLSKSISAYRVKQALEDKNIRGVEVLGIQSAVYTLSKKISKKELKDIISEWVDKNTAANIEAQINYARIPKGWKVPLGKGVKIHVNSRGRKAEGTLKLKIESRIGEAVLSQVNVKIVISKIGSALVATRPILSGEELSYKNLELRKVDVTKFNGMELSNLDMVRSKLSRRALPVGGVLRVQDIEEPVLVKSGSLNQIIVRNGKIKMRISGAKALQNGKKGDYILFSNPLNKNENLQAEVVKTGLAIMKLR
jgi:flagella basal body P-ring formation protein FlgA